MLDYAKKPQKQRRLVYRITEVDEPLHSICIALDVDSIDREDYELLACVDQHLRELGLLNWDSLIFAVRESVHADIVNNTTNTSVDQNEYSTNDNSNSNRSNLINVVHDIKRDPCINFISKENEKIKSETTEVNENTLWICDYCAHY
ncbi:hypothetical protein LSM04_000971 [Trypanosoma melophagium]|uniref:uncharacterized protein n=1 Tax=Trypanosoma melophagium TaxID=715481 RepID=UPI003519D8F2|nr:hypothetical protein LSM04_000971 [Trypanosoma melophagium]